ncbi:MAG: ribosome maturation factor RimP [Actinomycetota bacterium]|nr:ribosome maturation factor RimP [Actinomycetota bacterium]
MSSASTDHLGELLAPVVGALGVDLDAIELASAGRRTVLRVVVDRDGVLTLDDIADLTRAVSRQLDASDAMGERAYTLEVSSRGVDRPLTLPRHWVRNAGRLVRVRLVHGGELTGRVMTADDDGVALDVDGSARQVAYAEVDRAQVQVEFKQLEG